MTMVIDPPGKDCGHQIYNPDCVDCMLEAARACGCGEIEGCDND